LEASISNFLQFNPDIQARIALTPLPYLDGLLEIRYLTVLCDSLGSTLNRYGTDASFFAAAGLNCVVIGACDIA
jgi:hypothetical protein